MDLRETLEYLGGGGAHIFKRDIETSGRALVFLYRAFLLPAPHNQPIRGLTAALGKPLNSHCQARNKSAVICLLEGICARSKKIQETRYQWEGLRTTQSPQLLSTPSINVVQL